MKDKELKELQAAADNHLSFSLTLACPNHCKHCIVESGPDKEDTTISIETAQMYAQQMSDLYQAGIRQIGLTGGEPLIAPEPLKILSESAARAGIKCGVVTSAYWAIDEATALKVVESFPYIDFWDISTDTYHQEYVSLEKIRFAFKAVKKAGKYINLRVSYHYPINDLDKKTLSDIGEFAGQDEVTFQMIRKEGRGKDIKIADFESHNILNRPCLTRGILIRWDGSIGPCCVNLTEERNHPFQFGNAKNRPLVDILYDYRCHPLLQMIRAIGFSELISWVKEIGKTAELENSVIDDVCYLCQHLFTNPDLANYLSERAANPKNRLKIAVLAHKILGENYMLQHTLEELRPMRDKIPDFDQAQALSLQSAERPEP